ncbi:hypothetical protein DCC79_07235 [bacterium]|nr:YncE family protein [Chloroflexi bacterium CFX6]RIL10688.1 MAG: hypothetical protein DCC79_07235 [bacterium]
MVKRAIPASGKLVVSVVLASFIYLLLAAFCRLRDCRCNPRLVDTIAFKDTWAGSLAVNAVTGLLYAVEADAMNIAVFDVDDLERGPVARVPTLGYIGGIAVDERANRVYIGQGFAHRVRVIEGKTHAHHDIEVPDLVNALSSIAVDPERRRLYVARIDNHDIAIFDTASEAFLGAIDEGCCASSSIVLAVDPLTGFLYALNQTPPQVTVFDANHRKVADAAVGDVPAHLALDAPARRAYVTNSGSLFVSVIDTAPGHPRSFTVVDTIAMRENPAHIAIDSTAGRAYVTNNASDSIAIIDLARAQWVQDRQVGHQPMFVALDPLTSRIFASTDFSQVSVVQGCSAPRWPWQAEPARAPFAIATPPPLVEPTAVAERRRFVRCNRMFRIRTNCADGPEVHEARVAEAAVEAAGARVVDGGAAGKICGVDPDNPEVDLAAAGFFYSVPVIEPGADAPVVWTFHSTSRTFAIKDPPPAPELTRVAEPPGPPWPEALWYLSRYKTGHAPEAVAGCE